jgi:DNA-binding XRE family transcriptional regulator
MNDFSELYDAIVKGVREYEKKAKDKREARAKMIPQLLRLYRAKHGLSKEALAKELGVTRMEIFRWEKGTNVPGEDAMRKLEERKIIKTIG